MALILNYKKLNDLKVYAENHKITLTEGRAIQNNERPPVGDREEYRIYFPIGYKVVFSIDETLDHKWIRHMSMSINVPDRYPNEYALREVCEHLGYKNFDTCMILDDPFQSKAIRVIEFITD